MTFTRGIQSLYRAVDAYNQFVTATPRGLLPVERPLTATGEVAETDTTFATAHPALRTGADDRPTATGQTAAGSHGPLRVASSDGSAQPSLIDTEAGRIVSFGDAMAMLTDAGISVAPYIVILEGSDTHPDLGTLGERLVVKLADVPHRTELGAVRLNVSPADLPSVISDLRAIAAAHRVPRTIAVQAMIAGFGEAFAGLQCRSSLGSIALFGRGGVLVETSGGISGRFLPLDDVTIASLTDEVAAPIARLRGQRAWPLDHVRETLAAVNRLWATNRSWLDSADLNPLIVTTNGLLAVDALLIASPPLRSVT